MALLLLGFRPVIADIDTVWLHDPVSIVKRGNLIYPSHTKDDSTSTSTSAKTFESFDSTSARARSEDDSTNTSASAFESVSSTSARAGATSVAFESVDLSVTNDNGEICGCFVAVNNTPRAR